MATLSSKAPLNASSAPETSEGQVQDRLAHLSTQTLTLIRLTQPRTRLHRAHRAEVGLSGCLDADHGAPVDEGRRVKVHSLRRPVARCQNHWAAGPGDQAPPVQELKNGIVPGIVDALAMTSRRGRRTRPPEGAAARAAAFVRPGRRVARTNPDPSRHGSTAGLVHAELARSTSATSPSVAIARKASFIGTRRLPSPFAVSATSARAPSTALWSRSARTGGCGRSAAAEA